MLNILSLVVAAALSPAALAPALAVANDVTITLTGVQPRGGVLLTSLQTRDEFMQPRATHGEMVRDPRAGLTRVTFRNVAPGDYAFSALHDADGDGQMKMDGAMPAEGWAMVNGDSLHGVPTFDQVSFTVPASGEVALTVPMSYTR